MARHVNLLMGLSLRKISDNGEPLRSTQLPVSLSKIQDFERGIKLKMKAAGMLKMPVTHHESKTSCRTRSGIQAKKLLHAFHLNPPGSLFLLKMLQ
jgi:hypothetical protein